MATPPRYRQLTVDVPDNQDWFNDARQQLDSHMDDVTTALEGRLTRSNFASQKYVLEFTTSATVAASFPFQFDCSLTTQPEILRIARAEILTPGGSFSGARDVSHWELNTGNKIKINEITGLNPNTHYRFTLFIE